MGAGFLALAWAVAGCSGSSPYMRAVPATAAITAPADKASVVFVRPSGLGFLVNFAILDHEGHWIGDSVAQTHFAVNLPAGDYMFVAWAENTAALTATLVGGRTYYVEVTPMMGAISAHVKLEALTARHADWVHLSQWLHDTQRLEPLPTGAAHIDGAHALQRVASARENWQGYSNDEKLQRTLRAEDGVASAAPVAARVAPPVLLAPPPAPTVATACAPGCRAGFACSPEGQCVSACNPPCGSGEQCGAGGECIAASTALAPAAKTGPRDTCRPECRKGFVCDGSSHCVSACNPPCGPGEQCAEGGTCEATSKRGRSEK
jgi:hypothetical protein